MKTLLTPTPLIACEEKYLNRVLDELPDGNYSVIGSVDKGVIYFDCEPYLEKNYMFTTAKYTVYNRDDTRTPYADYSFCTLMESKYLSLDKKYLIIKPC